MTDSRQASPKLRRNWRRNRLSSIRELAALEWQRELWGKSSNPHQSYTEYFKTYWDDVIAEDGYPARLSTGFLTQREAGTAARLHELLGEYQEPSSAYDHEAILGDLRWLQVTEAAAQARLELLEIITDPIERACLLKEKPETP